MTFIEYEGKPWCSGRVYNNAPAATKVYCLFRPPPYWWIVEASGFNLANDQYNGTWILPLWRQQDGYNPYVQWLHTFDPPSHFRFVIEWGEHPPTAPQRRWIITFDNPPFFNQQRTWGLLNRDPVTDWMIEYDQVTPPKIFESPAWGLGDVSIQVKVGTYARLPAQSCYGDWRGPWPP